MPISQVPFFSPDYRDKEEPLSGYQGDRQTGTGYHVVHEQHGDQTDLQDQDDERKGSCHTDHLRGHQADDRRVRNCGDQQCRHHHSQSHYHCLW